MPIGDIVAVLTLLAAVIGFGVRIIQSGTRTQLKLEAMTVAIADISQQQQETQKKVDRHANRIAMITGFLQRRASIEVRRKVLGNYHSPLSEIPSQVRGWYAGLTKDLQAFYLAKGHAMSEASLFLELDKRFGDRLTADVCVPNGLRDGACLEIAAAIAREAALPAGVTPVAMDTLAGVTVHRLEAA